MTSLDLYQVARSSLLGSLSRTLTASFAPRAIIWMLSYTIAWPSPCARAGVLPVLNFSQHLSQTRLGVRGVCNYSVRL